MKGIKLLPIISCIAIIFSFLYSPPTLLATATDDVINAHVLPLTQSGDHTFTLQIKVNVKPGWHVFGKKACEVGLPPQLSITLPDGSALNNIELPEDHEFDVGEYRCSGYSSDFIVTTKFKVPENLQSKGDAAQVKLTWLACNGDACVPGKTKIQLPLDL